MEISFAVKGWPPAKNEALSMFNPTHGQRDAVRRLLEAASEALRGSSWNPLEREAVGLDVIVVETLNESPPTDATNSLGGVADVLQANRVNADLSHLGALASATLYADDRQIREVRYSVEMGKAPSYRVRVWLLDTASDSSGGG